jgi:hypothetical protein
MTYIQKLSHLDAEDNLVIDWQAGPDDAQYYSPETDENFEGFMKIVGDLAYFSTEHDGFKVWKIEMGLSADFVRNDPALIKKEQK